MSETGQATVAPADRLIAAADLLDKRASGASQPWKVNSNNFLAMPMIEMPYTIGIKAGSATEFYELFGADDKTTRYIATMHPEVGKAQAAMLRVLGSVDYPEVRMGVSVHTQKVFDAALALADLLLAGES